MLIFSILLIVTIFKSRRRVHLNNSEREKRRLKKDIKIAISSVLMNLLFFILIMPLDLYLLLPYYSDDVYYITSCIYYISFAVNFYIMFLTNSLFRKVFFSLF